MMFQVCSDGEALLAIKAVVVKRRLRGASVGQVLDWLGHLEREVWRYNVRVRLGISKVKRVYLKMGRLP